MQHFCFHILRLWKSVHIEMAQQDPCLKKISLLDSSNVPNKELSCGPVIIDSNSMPLIIITIIIHNE